MIKFIKIISFLAFLAACFVSNSSYAQSVVVPGAAAPSVSSGLPVNSKRLGNLSDNDYNRFFEGSFLFSSVERALIQKAVSGKVDEPEKNLAQEQKQVEVLKPEDFVVERNFEIKKEEQKTVKPQIPPRRLIVLGGILYKAKDNWVAWINGQKVTPDNYLPEIIEIKVENSSYVHLKWYDIGLQEVISITLRPNQVYDITTGILLPG